MKYVLGMVAITIIGTVCFFFETSLFRFAYMIVDYVGLGFSIGVYVARRAS